MITGRRTSPGFGTPGATGPSGGALIVPREHACDAHLRTTGAARTLTLTSQVLMHQVLTYQGLTSQVLTYRASTRRMPM